MTNRWAQSIFFPLPFCGDPKNRPSLVSIAFACKPKPASGRAFLVPVSQPAAAAAAAAALSRATGQSSSRSAAKRLSVCSGDIDASKTQSNRRTLPDSRRHSRPHLGPLQTTVSIFSFLVRPPLHASPRISSPPSTARARARARLLADDCQSPVTTPRVAQVDTAWTSPSCQPSPTPPPTYLTRCRPRARLRTRRHLLPLRPRPPSSPARRAFN